MTTVTWNSPADGIQADVNGNSYYKFTPKVTIIDSFGTPFYSILSGSIPLGTSLNNYTGKITGHLNNITASYSFTIRITNNGVHADRSFTQKVLYNNTIVEWNTPAEGIQPITYAGTRYSFRPSTTVTNPVGTTRYFLIDGEIPEGTRYNTSTGTFSGILKYKTYSQYEFTFTVRAMNNGAYSDRTFIQTITHTGYTWDSPIDEDQGGFTGGSYYSMVPIISVDPTGQTLVWSIESGTIPSGTAFDAANGTVSGILTNANSTYSYTIAAPILGHIVRKTFYGKIVAVVIPII